MDIEQLKTQLFNQDMIKRSSAVGWDVNIWKIVQPLEICDGMLTRFAEMTGERIS